MAAAFESFLHVVVAPGVVLGLKTRCEADRVSDLTKSRGSGHTRLSLQLLGNLLFETVLAFERVLEALQPAAMLVLLLNGLRIRGEFRLGLTSAVSACRSGPCRWPPSRSGDVGSAACRGVFGQRLSWFAHISKKRGTSFR